MPLGRATPAGTLAIACAGVSWGLVMHSMGWAQLAHYAQVRALSRRRRRSTAGTGRPRTRPGSTATSTRSSRREWRRSRCPPTCARRHSAGRLREGRGRERRRAHQTRAGADASRRSRTTATTRSARTGCRESEDNAPLVWALTLLVAVIPAVALLLGVRWVADRLEPGYGTAAAVTLGLATIVLIFAAEYFSHVIAAALGFAAFALLMREREGRRVARWSRRPACWRGSRSPSSTRRAWSAWCSSPTRSRAGRRLRRGAALRGGPRRGPPGPGLQLVGARLAARVRLRRRGGRARVLRARRRSASTTRASSGSPRRSRRAARPAGRQPRHADADPGARDGRRRAS